MGSSPRSDGGQQQGVAVATQQPTQTSWGRDELAAMMASPQVQMSLADKIQAETMARRSTSGYGGRGAPWTGGGMPARR